MLMNLHKHVWTEALEMNDFREDGERNIERLNQLVGLAEGYEKRVKEETELTKEQLKTRYVGRVDPKKRQSFTQHMSILPLSLTTAQDIEDVGQRLIEDNIVSVSRQMIDKEASVPKAKDKANGEANGHSNGAMEVDEEL